MSMKRLHFVFLVLLLSVNAFAAYVAVLETVADGSARDSVSLLDRLYLTNVLRERAIMELPAEENFIIMTRENIKAMLPPGKSIEDCEGGCLAETGRNIAADYVCQARVGRFGTKFTLSAELYETAGNRLIASFNGRGSDVEELLLIIETKSSNFFRRVKDFCAPVKVSALSKNVTQNVDQIADFNVEPKQKIEELPQNISSSLFSSSSFASSSVSSSLYMYLTDARDGRFYKVIAIGKQMWMAENLNYYETKNSFCYGNDVTNCRKYGRLYNWTSAMRVCPKGWHLPSMDEFKTLFSTIGGQTFAGKMLKSTEGWNGDGNGTDDFGFSAYPAGNRYSNGLYDSGGNYANFWCSTEFNSISAYYVVLFYDQNSAAIYHKSKDQGRSIRCVKD